MAKIRLENGLTITDLPSIAPTLTPLGIQLHHWPIGENAELRSLLAQDSLDDAEKETVLTALDHYFQRLRASDGYQSRDLIVLNPDVPNLDALLTKFDKIHTHADNEIRYIVDGEGVFGFVLPDKTQIELTIQPEEYINVPAGTEDWFVLTEPQATWPACPTTI